MKITLFLVIGSFLAIEGCSKRDILNLDVTQAEHARVDERVLFLYRELGPEARHYNVEYGPLGLPLITRKKPEDYNK